MEKLMFNIAIVGICVGLGCIIISYIWGYIDNKKKRSNNG